MQYDPMLNCVYMEVPQWKTAKAKKIALISGADRHCCWFTAWGDFLVLQEGQMPFPRLSEHGNVPLWLFPELSPDRTKSAGAKVGDWMKALCVGGAQRYKNVWIKELPEGINAGTRLPWNSFVCFVYTQCTVRVQHRVCCVLKASRSSLQGVKERKMFVVGD